MEDMKILFVDYRSNKSHKNFNKIHIDSLLSLGHSITLVGREGQFDNIPSTSLVSVKIIPNRFYHPLPFAQLLARLREIVCLYWIKHNYDFSSFDVIILPTYDILSLFAFRISRKFVVINHNNVSLLSNKIKRILTGWLPKQSIHVALNTLMKERLNELFPSKRVYYIPHGILYKEENRYRPELLNGINKFLFCPVNSNYDNNFVRKLFCSDEFSNFLLNNDIFLLVKETMNIPETTPHIISLPRISDPDYNYLLSHAECVILPYDNDFKYRCSGILFECVNYNTPVLSTPIDDMLLFKEMINIFYFSNCRELIQRIIQCQDVTYPKRDLSILDPKKYWESLINKEFNQ